ncbi:hypothetical protein H5410_039577 [Solanum commersonii]|uniref:Uncharacterized protein n=1 Tax=Solanum commersonii TaxID=4109 RepID=A0A9J5XNK2_SOLCO|nr:hypothetical protein H5410_039577 [Solanum commersonii]
MISSENNDNVIPTAEFFYNPQRSVFIYFLMNKKIDALRYKNSVSFFFSFPSQLDFKQSRLVQLINLY